MESPFSFPFHYEQEFFPSWNGGIDYITFGVDASGEVAHEVLHIRYAKTSDE